MILAIKLSDPSAMPSRAHSTDAGLDLRSMHSVDIFPEEMKLIDTGVAVKIPVGYVGLIFLRSSMGKKGFSLANAVGVIDTDYRGNIKVMLRNISDEKLVINKEDRIAQLVVLPIDLPELVEFLGTEEEWNDTERGSGGFGSTGKQ
jgi:dUTP pyrophosphatase